MIGAAVAIASQGRNFIGVAALGGEDLRNFSEVVDRIGRACGWGRKAREGRGWGGRRASGPNGPLR